MLLAINIGNSNITCGGYAQDGKLTFSSNLYSDSALSSDELTYKLINMLDLFLLTNTIYQTCSGQKDPLSQKQEVSK